MAAGHASGPRAAAKRPKQFLPVGGELPLLAQTLERLRGLVPPERALVVTSQAHAQLVRETLPELPPENILAEPEPRNTAPCVAWAAWEIERRDPQAVQLVLPADHVIQPAEEFQRAVRAAARHAASQPALLCFGIRPTFPATGFGYIAPAQVVASGDAAEPKPLVIHAVERFVEKPTAERAQSFVDQGYLWNAGIFVWSTSAIRAATASFLRPAEEALSGIASSAEIARAWPQMPAEPVDVAIMEKAENVCVMPVSYDWNDVGSWTALPDVIDADAQGNVLSGAAQVITEDVRDCIVYGEAGRLTALIGVEGLVVVQAGNAVLVCPRERAQEVKGIVERLAKDGPEFL